MVGQIINLQIGCQPGNEYRIDSVPGTLTDRKYRPLVLTLKSLVYIIKDNGLPFFNFGTSLGEKPSFHASVIPSAYNPKKAEEKNHPRIHFSFIS